MLIFLLVGFILSRIRTYVYASEALSTSYFVGISCLVFIQYSNNDNSLPSIADCTPECASGGFCSGKNVCTCSPGFTGALCDQCLPGFWGPTCQRK